LVDWNNDILPTSPTYLKMSSATVIGKVVPTLSTAFPQPVDNSLSWIDLSETQMEEPRGPALHGGALDVVVLRQVGEPDIVVL
jgi:hypothetical protein